MKTDATVQWLDKRLQVIREHAADIAPKFYPETTHRLRVEAKKLKAVLRFLSKDEQYKLHRRFRKLYRDSGAIRDRQVELAAAATEMRHKLPGFVIWLAHREAAAIDNWRPRKVRPAVQALQRQIGQLPRLEFDKDDLLKHYSAFTEWLQATLEGELTDEALHDIRKHTKDMQYTLAFCRKVHNEAYQALAYVEAQLEALTAIAGVYQDSVNLLQAVEGYQQDYKSLLTPEEAAAATQAGSDWRRDKEAALQAMLSAAEALLEVKPAVPPDLNQATHLPELQVH